MSNLLTEVEEGELYAGYDSISGAHFCTPTFMGCSACAYPNVVDGYAALVVSFNSPVGSFSKTFKLTNNVNFDWEPFSRFKLQITVTNFSKSGNITSFDAGFKIGINVPVLGWKYASYQNHFFIRGLVANASDIDDNQFSSMLALHASFDNESKGDPKSKFLQGDIYSNYLNDQAGFPTIPVVSCVVTCTGVPFICAAQQQAGNLQAGQAYAPTQIISSCPTAIGPNCQFPPITSLPQLCPKVTAIPFVCQNTLIPAICGPKQHGLLQANQVEGGFPTVPVVSCVVTCTGVPFICAAQQQAVQGTPTQTVFPTIYPNSCPTSFPQCIPTYLPVHSCPNASSGVQGTANNVQGGFPTVPVISCITTCTGIPYIC